MISKKRRLIFLWLYIEWGGAQIYLLAIMKEARPDWDIVVILPRDSVPDILGYLTDIGVKYEFIDVCLDGAPAPTLGRKVERQWRRFSAEIASLRYLRRYNLRESILHVETLPWQSWQYLAALSLLGANVFVTLHNALPRFPVWRELIWKARMQFLSRLPGFHIFTSNHDTKNKFRGWVEDGFWQNMTVTYTCVNPVEIAAASENGGARGDLRRRHMIPEDSFVVLCVGQFIDRKGRWTFLEAARQVHEAHPDISFVWVTPKLPSGPDIEKIEKYGLGDSFRLILSASVGSTRHDILQFFRAADIFALPSFVEGLPIALLEAMALGLPVISTNINAIPEAIKDRETGILIDSGDSSALAASILELKKDAGLRRELSEKGRVYVLEHFDERVASRAAIDAYEECFANA